MTADERGVRLLAALRHAVDDLGRYEREVSRSRLESDGDAWRMVRQALQEAIQACIDLAHVLLADMDAEPVDTYRGAFDALRVHADLPPDLAMKLSAAAGLRNVLLHVYTELDLGLIHEAYTTEREHLAQFAAWAASRMAREDGNPVGS